MSSVGPLAFAWPRNEESTVIGWGPNGRYLKNYTASEFLSSQFVTPAIANGDCAAAARTAFDSGKPLLTTQADVDADAAPSLTINPTTEASADTEAARHAVIENALAWQATCLGIVPDIIIADGYYTVNGYSTVAHSGKLTATAAPDTRTISAISTVADSSTFTADASTDIITHSISNLINARIVQFTTTGTLPAGLSLATDYYVFWVSATTIKVATSATNLTLGTYVNITDAGTGTHTITAVNMFTSTITVTSALPSRVVAGFALTLQNVRGDGHAEALTGAHIVNTVAGNLLSFTVRHQVYGVMPTSVTTIDTATDAGIGTLRSRVIIPKACLRINSAGYNGTAEDQEGYLNFEKSDNYELEYLGFSYNQTNYAGGSDEHDLIFVKRGNVKALSCSFAGAGDKVIRIAYNATFYGFTCGIGGAILGQQLFQGYGNSDAQFVRCSMGGASGEGISPTVSTRVALPSTIVASCARGLRPTYADASVTLTGSARVVHCNEGYRIDTGSIQCTTDETITKCTDPLSIQAVGYIYGNPTITANTNSTIASNTYINGGAWLLTNAMVAVPVTSVWNSSTAPQGPGFDTNTYVSGSQVLVSTGQLKAGTCYRCVMSIAKTAAGIAAPVVQVKYGANATTADSTRATLTFPAQTAAADNGRLVIEVTFNAVGTATIQAVGTLTHTLAATGLSTSSSPTVEVLSSSFSSTAGNYIGIAINAGTSAAWTISRAESILYNINQV